MPRNPAGPQTLIRARGRRISTARPCLFREVAPYAPIGDNWGVTAENPTAETTAKDLDTNDQRAVRMDKRERLLSRGVQPFPVKVERTDSLAEVRKRFDGTVEAGESTGETVSVTGRVMFIRNTGKLCFATLQEGGPQGSGSRLQAMISLAEVGEDALADWKSLVDLGDRPYHRRGRRIPPW